MNRDIKDVDKDIRTFTNKYEQAKMRGDEIGRKRYAKKIAALYDELEELYKGDK